MGRRNEHINRDVGSGSDYDRNNRYEEPHQQKKTLVGRRKMIVTMIAMAIGLLAPLYLGSEDALDSVLMYEMAVATAFTAGNVVENWRRR